MSLRHSDPRSSRVPPQHGPDTFRIGIDAAQLGVRGKGVARYLSEMLPELAVAAEGFELLALTPRDVELPDGARSLERVEIDARPAIVWEQLRLARTARRLGLSLVHTVSDRLPAYRAPRTVLYLFEDPRHRIAAAREEAGARVRIAGALTQGLFPGTLRRAAMILTSSEATRRDLEARGVSASRVRVVYPGVSSLFLAGSAGEVQATRERLRLPSGYVLHFSSDDPRDNSAVAFRAYAALIEGMPEAPPLVVAGPVDAQLASQAALARSLGVHERVHWLGHQSGTNLTGLYRAASVYVDPTLYEGFGFQVAEALASGIPVVCSDTTSLPEVVGDAGILVAPDDVRGFSEALGAVLRDPARAAELGARGAVQAKRFTWSRTAAETVDAWREVLALPPIEVGA